MHRWSHCYKLLESKHLSKLDLEENDFSIEVEILQIFKFGLTLKEQLISYEGRIMKKVRKSAYQMDLSIFIILNIDSEINFTVNFPIVIN